MSSKQVNERSNEGTREGSNEKTNAQTSKRSENRTKMEAQIDQTSTQIHEQSVKIIQKCSPRGSPSPLGEKSVCLFSEIDPKMELKRSQHRAKIEPKNTVMFDIDLSSMLARLGEPKSFENHQKSFPEGSRERKCDFCKLLVLH